MYLSLSVFQRIKKKLIISKSETVIYWIYKWEVLKKMNIENLTDYVFNDLINIKNFDSNLLKVMQNIALSISLLKIFIILLLLWKHFLSYF